MGALDDLRGQIRFRGLKGSQFADPVKEFKGTLLEIRTEEAEFNEKKTGRLNVIFHFGEVEIIVSSEPYPFPVKDVIITFSESHDSRWKIFADSGLGFLEDDEEFGSLKGRRLHLKQESHVIFQGKEKGRVPADCWIIAGVEGTSAGVVNGKENTGPAESQLLLLLNGRTEQQFNMEALRLPAVKADSDLVTRLLNSTLLSSMVSRKLVEKNDTGVYGLTEKGMEELQG